LKTTKGPYALPRRLPADLARVLAFWQRLKRHEAQMPFWDDVKLTALPELAGQLALIDAFENPARFRFGFDVVGDDIKRRYGGELGGKFLDEIEVRAPLQFLTSQASAAVQSGKPTHYQHEAADAGAGADSGYSRLVLPLWGNGRIGMLLVAYAWE